MGKIICDVCGTRYPDTADQCPICGRVRAESSQLTADDILLEETRRTSSGSKNHGGHFSKSNVRKRNRNAPRSGMEELPRPTKKNKTDTDREFDFVENQPQNKSNPVLNILLVVTIIALLSVSGYIFVEYFLPGMIQDDSLQPPVVPETSLTETTEEITTLPTVPCTSLTLPEGEDQVLLDEAGLSWLINVVVLPEDTTDELVFLSSDEAVVTVNEEGRVTAVGEGKAVVTVICGDMSVDVQVTCAFNPTETTEAGTTETEQTQAPTEAPTEPLKDVKLKVDMTDISFNARNQGYTFRVEGLKNSEVQWTSENEKVVTVKNGKAISVGGGTTNIVVQYGDQKVKIVVRCKF